MLTYADVADGFFAFRLRLQPAPKLLDSCGEFVREGPTGKLDTLSMPLRVGVPDQVDYSSVSLLLLVQKYRY